MNELIALEGIFLNGKQFYVPAEKEAAFAAAFEDPDGFHHCPWFDGLTGFGNACESCKISFG